MNKNIGMVVTFVAGIVVGVASTYKISKTKYQNIANEEIESVISTFDKMKAELTAATDVEKGIKQPVEAKVVVDVPGSKGALSEYKDTIDRFGYDKVSEQINKPKRNKKRKEEEIPTKMIETTPGIYIISPDEYNTLDGFSTETFYYSSDNQLLDADYEMVSDEDITSKIDHDPRGHFGEYEDDSVYVRNELLMCDYEILLSMKTCTEIMEG